MTREAEAAFKALELALKRLVVMARTAGGVAGPDPGLMNACDEAEALLSRIRSLRSDG